MLSPALLFAQVQIQGPRNSPDVYSGVVYGPIDQSDTLWRIASRYKQDSAFSVYQTMLAIYELNPQAFENQNFNTMVNGATLQLPSDRYIARMDVQRARAKAEADDRAFGRPNSVQAEPGENPASNANNLKPEVPLVNQEDLSATQLQLQNQLNSLNRQQTVQFNQVKEQVSASIGNVQALIDENRKMYERLDQVNQDISELREKVEGDVQNQIDQQLALQKELIELVKQAEQRQLDKEAESIWTTLSSPLAVITLSSIFTAGVLLILGLFLLRRPKNAVNESSNNVQSKDIVDDELVIGEMDDDFDSDADDLMAALDQEMDDDDILSSDLEDGLDELGVDEDEFAEADEMLVPDTDEKNKPKQKKRLDQVDDELSFITDAISLDDDEFENQEIDLNPKETENTAEQSAVIEDVTADLDLDSFGVDEEPESGVDALDDLASVSEAEEPESLPPEAPSQDEEISAQESPENTPSPNANKLADSGTALGVDFDESGDINDESLKNIEESINETTEEFEKLSSEILDELENGPVEPEQSPQSPPITPSSNAPETESAISSESPEPYEEEAVQLGDVEDEADQREASAVSDDIDDNIGDAPEDALADELLSELEDEQASEELDSLLEEFTQKPDENSVEREDESLELDADTQNQDAEFSVDLDDDEQEPEDTSNQMANELLSDLDENDEVEADDLDALLAEYSADSDETENNDTDSNEEVPTDTDSLLDDIPSLGGEPTSVDAKASAEAKDTSAEVVAEIANDGVSDDLDEDEDVLADLPGLDDWLEDDSFDKDIKDLEKDSSGKTELDVLADIESSDFDDLLSELDADNIEDTIKDIGEKPSDETSDDPLLNAGLDLDALMLDDEEPENSVEEFINVDDLLSESEGLTPLDDDDLELNIEGSLPNMKGGDSVSTDADSGSENTDQASNLDLAQVYMDMDDVDAAKEILLEVQEKGSDDQVIEATQLLQQISDKP